MSTTFEQFLGENSHPSRANNSRGKATILGKAYYPSEFTKFFANNNDLFLAHPDWMQGGAEVFRKKIGEIVSPLPTESTSLEAPARGASELRRFLFENAYIVKLTGVDGLKFFHKETGELLPHDEKDLQEAFLKFSDFREAVLSRKCFLDPYFKPFKAFDWAEVVETSSINLYAHPEWRRDASIDPASPQEMAPVFEFLEFLLPNKESRRSTLHWVYWSLSHRCREYLVMIGKEGAGKGLFADILLGGLHGASNFSKTKSNFLTTDFNGYLKNKTYVYADELECHTMSGLENLKRQIEDRISFESKGVDQQTEENHASICITGNFYHSFYVDPATTRKFTYAVISDQKIEKVKGKDFVENLVGLLKDPKVLKGFYLWLEKNFKGKGKYDVYHGEPWEKHCYEAAFQSIRWTVDRFIDPNKECEIFTYAELKSGYNKVKKELHYRHFYPTIDMLRNFFDEFTWKGEKVAEFVPEKEAFRPINSYAYKPLEDEI